MLTYSLVGGDGIGFFDIIPSTGEVYLVVADTLEAGVKGTYSLTVRATDAGGLTGDSTVTATVIDSNDAPTMPDYAFSIDENSARLTEVTGGSCSATDPDVPATQVEYIFKILMAKSYILFTNQRRCRHYRRHCNRCSLLPTPSRRVTLAVLS